MLLLLYFRTELTIPLGRLYRISVLQKLSGCDDEINIDGLTQPYVPMKVFHLSAHDSVHYAAIYSA